MAQTYDTIGAGYARARRADPRIAATIRGALGHARTVVNVGAGTGSYEPEDRFVVAVEPSRTMIDQRPPGSAPVVQASATRLPFREGAFDVALAVLTIHHWPDQRRGLEELMRVSRDGAVLLTYDPGGPGFWLVEEYFPDIAALDREIFPTFEELREALGPIAVHTVPIPHDCEDGFLAAYWRRPHAYLDPTVRGGISTFARARGVDEGLARLRADLDDGSWARKYADLLARDELDAGYRLVVSGGLAHARNNPPQER